MIDTTNPTIVIIAIPVGSFDFCIFIVGGVTQKIKITRRLLSCLVMFGRFLVLFDWCFYDDCLILIIVVGVGVVVDVDGVAVGTVVVAVVIVVAIVVVVVVVVITFMVLMWPLAIS